MDSEALCPDESKRSGADDYDSLLAQYVDRLLDGEAVDANAILQTHPDFGEELIADLKSFIDPSATVRREPVATLGDYTLRRQIGRGGMGVVYEAWQNSLDRQVALKVLPAGIAADDKSFHRFMREAKTAAKINHPHIVGVYGMGVEQNTPYYAMEFVDGETLAQMVRTLKDAPPDTPTQFGTYGSDLAFYANLARAFANAADGLQHAHAKGIVHRDIKPSNLILDREGRLRILDFGLAKLDGQESITMSGDLVGTVQYMSPEQAQVRKIPVDHRTDIYSLGATMYEVLALRPPFKGKDHHDTLSQIITRDAEPLRTLNVRVPCDLETIILKCMRKDARDRYGTAEALGQDLQRFARGDPVEARPESRFERVRRRAWAHRTRLGLGTAVIAIIALGVALATIFWRQHRQEQVVLYDRLLLEGIARSLVPTVAGGSDIQVAEHLTRIRESAVASLRDATQVLPERPEAWWQLGRTLESLGQTAEARTALERALAPSDDFVPALVTKLRLNAEKPDGGDLAAQLANLKSRFPGAWQGLLVDVALAELRADHAAVERLYGELLDSARTHEPYHGFLFESLVFRGCARMQLGRTIAATQDFLEARWRAPEILSANLLLAASYYSLDADADAHAILDEAQRRFPSPDARLAIADIALRFHDLDRALAAAEDLPPESRLATRAKILCRAGRYDEAVDAGRAAIDSGVQDPVVYADTADALLNLKRLNEAEATLLRGLQAYPEDGSLKYFLHSSISYFRCRHNELLNYELSLPMHERNWRAIGWCQYRLGRYEEAQSAFQRLIDNHPSDAHAWFSRAWAHCRNDRPDAAINDWIQAARLSSGTDILTIWSMAKLWDSPAYRDAMRPYWSHIDRVLSTPEARRRDDALWLGLRAVAKAYCSTPDHDEAHRLAKQGVEASHGCDGQALSRLAEVLYARGEVAEAIRVLEKAGACRNRPGIFETQLADYRATLGEGVASAATIDSLAAGLPRPGTPEFDAASNVLRSRIATIAPALSGYLETMLLASAGHPADAVQRLETAVLHEGLIERAAVIRLARLYATTGRRDDGLALLEERLLTHGDDGLDAWEAWLEVGSRKKGYTPAEMLARLDALGEADDAAPHTNSPREDVRVVLSQLRADGAFRINCGGADLVDSQGRKWLADRFFEGGDDGFRFVPPLEGTNDPALFTQHRAFWMDFEYAPGYRIPLPAGSYELTLLFVQCVAHPRPIRFAIECEGQALDPDFLVNEKGFGVAQQRTFRVRVDDGALDLVLRPKPWISVVSGIELRPVD